MEFRGSGATSGKRSGAVLRRGNAPSHTSPGVQQFLSCHQPASVPSSPILITLMIEALSSFETSALTRATRPIIPEDAIFRRMI
jgi:hypothetical protein